MNEPSFAVSQPEDDDASSTSELEILTDESALKRRNVAIMIIAAYVAVLPVSGFFAYKFLNSTEMMYGAPSGTLVYDTEIMSQTVFRDQVFHNPLFMLVTSKLDNESVTTVGDGELCKLTSYLNTFVNNIEDFTHVVGYCVYLPTSETFASRFVSTDNTSTFIAADFLLGDSLTSTNGVQNDLMDIVNTALSVNFTHLSVKFASVGLVSGDLMSGLVRDLMMIDAISIPLAMAALAYCLRSVRMLVLPAITLPITVCIAFAVCYPVTVITKVSSFAPEMASATMLAITIDYSLFILSRFNELAPKYELLGGSASLGVKYKVCVDTAMLSAHNIVVSGLTIAVALGGLVLMPVKFIGTIGYIFFFCCVTAVCVSLTIMPSILFVFYPFFRKQTDFGAPARAISDWWRDRKSLPAQLSPVPRNSSTSMTEEAKTQRLMYSDAEGDLRGVDPFSPGTHEFYEDQRTEQYFSTWFRIGSFANRNPWLIILLVLGFGAPFMWQVTELQVDFDLFNQVPRSSPHGATLKKIIGDMGAASTPFYITIDTGKPNGLMTEHVFSAVQNLTYLLSARTDTPLAQLESFAMLAGIPIGLPWVNVVKDVVKEYRIVWNNTVDSQQRAGIIQLFPSFDPFDAQANRFINKIYDAIEGFDTQGNFTIGLMGASSASWAIMRKVMKLFPLQIGITFAVIFAFIAVVFRSILIPLRMVITVSYTVSVSLGMGVIFFQYGWSHHLWTAMKGVQSYSWTVPIFAFSLLCALGLDYDVFLLTRMVEMRKHGYEPNAAVVKAVWKTGRIISFAGIIMAISFGSMVFGGITMLNQFGFIASFAVLLDSFVIRSLFVPAIMSVAPAAVWFPRNFERSDREVDDMTG